MMHHYKLGLRLAAALNSCNRQGRRQRNLVIRSIAIDCPSRMQLGGQVDAITHYRGLAKNTAQMFSLFGLANLLLAKRHLIPITG